jgi:hypothetical protein
VWLAAATLGSSAAAQDNDGAIAYSPGSGAHGWSNDYGSQSAAEAVALQKCRAHAADCSVAVVSQRLRGTGGRQKRFRLRHKALHGGTAGAALLPEQHRRLRDLPPGLHDALIVPVSATPTAAQEPCPGGSTAMA